MAIPPPVLFGPLFLFLCILSINWPAALSLLPDPDALLLLKKSFNNTDALSQWTPETQPCEQGNNWVGVFCISGAVSGLKLGQMNLSGVIDVEALVQMNGLRYLNFANNSFSGPIPGLNKIGSLRSIYLDGNQFSGEIPPDYFTSLSSLKRLWLGNNSFTGAIPASLAELALLVDLRLQNNNFSGSIPPLGQTLDSFDVSNNNLTGEIPPILLKFNSSSFQGNPGLCSDSLDKPCNLEAPPPLPDDIQAPQLPNGGDGSDGNNGSKIAYGLLIGSAILLGVASVAIYLLKRRQDRSRSAETVYLDDHNDEPVGVGIRESNSSRRDMESSRKSSGIMSLKGSSDGKGAGNGDLVLLNNQKVAFGMENLLKAAAELLGNGSLGASYKATMSSGLTVVVKRVKEFNNVEKNGFEAEMNRFGRLSHPNVLTPLAYHYRPEEKLLVSEYIKKGSLLYVLHGDRGLLHAELNWPVRLKIVKGIAQGLGYLHSEFSSSELPHGDVKSSNVLLGPDYDPLLVDYGFRNLIGANPAVQSLSAYKSPEAMQHRIVSPKCDVYCLGVIILELLTGKFPSQFLDHGQGGTDVVQWARSAISENRENELFDPDILNSKTALGDIQQLLHIGAACTEFNPEQRLDMKEANRRISDVKFERGQEPKSSSYVLPSLREGVSNAAHSHVTFLQEGNRSGRRHEGSGDRSSSKYSGNFHFDIS